MPSRLVTTVLLVEDVPELREWLRSLLAAQFPAFEFRTAGSAPEVHLALGRERPSLIILDEVLGPGEDLASLLEMVNASGVPIALMTGMDPAHRNAARLPSFVTRRIEKPHWGTGEGAEAFVQAVSEVIALTTRGQAR